MVDVYLYAFTEMVLVIQLFSECRRVYLLSSKSKTVVPGIPVTGMLVKLTCGLFIWPVCETAVV